MSKIAIYGGSFNPIHFGHLGLSRWVLEHTDIDEVWLMVSPNNPLKDRADLAPDNLRLAGARKAIEEAIKKRPLPSNKHLIASDFEFSLPRPSYTANTLRELSKAYPENDFCLLIGEDNWLIFDRWREHDWILAHYPILIYPRHNNPSGGAVLSAPATFQRSDFSAKRPNTVLLSSAPYFDISSTAIRQQQKNAK